VAVKKWLLLSLCVWAFPVYGIRLIEKTGLAEFCQKAATHSAIFANFRSQPIFEASKETGQQYLDFIVKNYPELLSHLELLRTSDTIGGPAIYKYGEWGSFSPMTLRYIKIAGDLLRQFGDLSQLHIVEVGAGYGGMCKVLADVAGFASYTIVDIPQCTAIAKKYLSSLGVQNVTFLDDAELTSPQTFDLLISNYSFSEMSVRDQYRTLVCLIENAPRGYMLLNSLAPAAGSPCMQMNTLISLLLQMGKVGTVESEKPLIHPSHLLLTWRSQ